MSARSGRQHKAWGGAKRNPRDRRIYSKRAREVGDSRSEPRGCRTLRALRSCFPSMSWGSAMLHPRLYADARFARSLFCLFYWSLGSAFARTPGFMTQATLRSLNEKGTTECQSSVVPFFRCQHAHSGGWTRLLRRVHGRGTRATLKAVTQFVPNRCRYSAELINALTISAAR